MDDFLWSINKYALAIANNDAVAASAIWKNDILPEYERLKEEAG